MKALFAVLVAIVGFTAVAETPVTPQLKDGLIGFSECKSVGNDHFKGKIFIHEEFLHQEAYAVLAGDVNENGAKGSFAVFFVTNPDMDDKSLVVHLSREGKRLGTLAVLGNLKGLKGTLKIEQDTLSCEPIAP